MISLGDAASLKDLPILLSVPFFTAAAMVDHILDTPRDVILALPMWWVRRVTQSDASLAEFFLGCFVLVGLVGAIVIVAIYMVVDLDQAVERIPVVGKHLAVLIWVVWTCITAGLFVVETLLREPDLFDTYIALDPSLWWNDRKMLDGAPDALRTRPPAGKTIYLANSGEPELAEVTRQFAGALEKGAFPGLKWHYEPMPSEQHSTIYHPAALRAFRTVFKPAAAKP